MPFTVLNGLFSLVRYGLNDCFGGFYSESSRWWNCNEGDYSNSHGRLTYSPSSSSSEDVVDELATLLTAGRLDASNRVILKDAIDGAVNLDAGFRLAQQLIMTSPEFHSTNIIEKQEEPRGDITFPPSQGADYKAILVLMLSGGCDSFNMLVPHTCSAKDMYAEYFKVREQVALSKSSLLMIDSNNQICEKFGVHQNLPIIQELYNDGDLLFLANTGSLTKPANKDNYYHVTKQQLFAHNHMQRDAQSVDPFEKIVGTGVVGRIADRLEEKGQKVGAFSIDRSSISLIGETAVGKDQFILSQNGINEFNSQPSSPTMQETIQELNEATTPDSGFFAETWSESLLRSLAHNKMLYNILTDATTSVTFPKTNLGNQLKVVAQVIGSRLERSVDADVFYVEMGGFDTHSNVEQVLQNRFQEMNGAIEAFTSEIKQLNLWDSVTTVQISDFARTLNPNSGDGTDHAWGGNYFMFGGSVKGGKIYGTYPDNLTDDGPKTLERGRLIPDTPWDAPFESLARWAGIDTNDELDKVCPNRHNFPESVRFNNNSLFKSAQRRATSSTRGHLRK